MRPLMVKFVTEYSIPCHSQPLELWLSALLTRSVVWPDRMPAGVLRQVKYTGNTQSTQKQWPHFAWVQGQHTITSISSASLARC